MALVLPLALALVAGGCGGGKDEADVEAVLDQAFSRSVRSADVKIDAQLELNGLKGLDRPVRVQASGPYVSAKGSLPKLDIDVRVGASEAGQTFQTGLLSTGDRAFVKFGGEFYEQSRTDVTSANRRLGGGRGGGSLKQLGLNPRAWVIDARQEDDERVGGVTTEHLRGRLDSRRVFADFNKLVTRSANAIGGTAPDVPNPLTGRDLDRLSEIVKDPSFDVYVGKNDDIIRRVSASLRFTIPESDRAKSAGIESGSLRFSLELRDVNGDQAVEAPAKARPISDLTKQLGGAGALRGLSGGGTQGGGGSGGGGAGSTLDPDALKRYGDCLDAARPDDTQALTRCREFLR